MTTTDKENVELSFNLKTSRYNIMYNLFYLDIYEFVGDLEVMIDEGTFKNIHMKYAQALVKGK